MNFYRDQRIASVTVDESLIQRLAQAFQAMYDGVREGLTDDQRNDWFFTMIIRFDGKGFRLLNVNDLLDHFRHAQMVERILFTIENGISLRSNRATGQFLELKLDAFNPDNCSLAVLAVSKANMDLAFNNVDEILFAARNYHRHLRSTPVRLFVQLLGVIAVFALGLWAASKLQAKLVVENAFLFAFLFVFIIASNLWSYVYPWMLGLIDRVFPNIHFKPEREGWSWLWRNLVASAIFAAFLVVFAKIAGYITSALAPLWAK